MKNKFLLIILTFCIINQARGQTIFDSIYHESGNESGMSVKQTTDGGYLIGGYNDNGNYNSRIYFIKTNENGSILWSYQHPGGGWNNGYSVLQSSDGGYVIAGQDNLNNNAAFRVALIKLDSAGTLQWSKSFSYGGLWNYGYSLAETADNGFVITGCAGNSQIYMIKTDASGNTQWQKTYGNESTQTGRCVKQVPGGYVISGYYTASNGYYNMFLMKTDTNGDTAWLKKYPLNNHGSGYSVLSTNSGYLICGSAGNRLSVTKTELNGTVNWQKKYFNNNCAYSIASTTDHGIIICGNKVILKTDTNGQILWHKLINGTAYSIEQTADGGFICSGCCNLSPNTDVFLLKFRNTPRVKPPICNDIFICSNINPVITPSGVSNGAQYELYQSEYDLTGVHFITSYTYYSNVTDTVWMSVDSSGYHSAKVPVIIHVTPKPVPAISGPDTVCQNEIVLYHTQPGNTNYTWNVSYMGSPVYGGGANDDYIAVKWILYGSYASVGVHYTDTNGCSGASQAKYVFVRQFPEVSLGSYSNFCLNTPPFLLSGGSPAGGIYSGDGVSNGVFTPALAGAGNHTITYTYSGIYCTSTDSVEITVDSCYVGLNSRDVNNDFSFIFTYDKVTIIARTSFPYALTVFDMQGKALINEPIEKPQTDVDLSKLSKGIYLLSLHNKQGVFNYKFIK